MIPVAKWTGLAKKKKITKSSIGTTHTYRQVNCEYFKCLIPRCRRCSVLSVSFTRTCKTYPILETKSSTFPKPNETKLREKEKTILKSSIFHKCVPYAGCVLFFVCPHCIEHSINPKCLPHIPSRRFVLNVAVGFDVKYTELEPNLNALKILFG